MIACVGHANGRVAVFRHFAALAQQCRHEARQGEGEIFYFLVHQILFAIFGG